MQGTHIRLAIAERNCSSSIEHLCFDLSAIAKPRTVKKTFKNDTIQILKATNTDENSSKKLMKPITLILTLLFAVISLNAQDIEFRENIDKDSLFMASLHKLPLDMQEEFAYMYYLAGQQERAYLLFMISMPQSSKK